MQKLFETTIKKLHQRIGEIKASGPRHALQNALKAFCTTVKGPHWFGVKKESLKTDFDSAGIALSAGNEQAFLKKFFYKDIPKYKKHRC